MKMKLLFVKIYRNELPLQEKIELMAFSLFKKKKEEKDDRYQLLTVKEVVPIAKNAVNLVFEKPASFDYQPGQFITIIKKINDEKLRRAYSLCTTPFEDTYPAVTVKRIEDGRMSTFLTEEVKAGDQLEIMNPMGIFTLSYHSENKRNAIFWGGGSGITPLISIIRSLLIKELASRVTLIYCNQSEEFIIFKTLLAELEKKYDGRFRVIHILEHGEAHHIGKPTASLVQQLCEELKVDDSVEYYTCGPQPMMDVVKEGLATYGVKLDKVKMESFEAGKTSPAEIFDSSKKKKSEITIILDGEEHTFTAKKNIPVLEIALAHNLDMPYSCRSGLCTACRGKCLEGAISIDQAEGLSPKELEEGYVLTCVGIPITNHVKIKIG